MGLLRFILTILILLVAYNGWTATTFNDTTSDHKWSTAANWSDGIPDSSDAVDINAAVTALIIDTNVEVASFNATAATVTISGTGSFTCYGNFTTDADVSWTHTGDMILSPPSGVTATITTASIASPTTTLPFPTSSLSISGEGTVYLAGNLCTNGQITHSSGTIDLRAYALKGTNFISSGTTRVLTDTSGGSTGNIVLTGLSGTLLNVSATNLTVSGTPTIKVGDVGRYTEKTLTGDITLVGAGKSWGDLLLRRHAGNYAYIISDSNTWRYVTVETPNSEYQYNKLKITSGETQTVLGITAHGQPLYNVYIESTSSGNAATIQDTSGLNTFLYANIKDITVSGGAVFGAGGTTNVNVSGNTGFAWSDQNHTYYVKSTGNDALDGLSDTNAWASISKVQSTVIPGDTVYFNGGDTWTGATPILTTTAGVNYYGTGYGTGRAIIQPSTATTNTGTIHISYPSTIFYGFEINVNDLATNGIMVGGYAQPNADVNDILIDDCLIYSAGTEDSWLGGGISVSPRNSADGIPHATKRITIQNTEIHDTGRSGISFYPSWSDYDGNFNDVGLIRNCTIYNAGKNGTTPDSGHGFHIKDDSRNITVEYNYLHDNTYYGVLYESYVEDPDVAVTSSINRYNIIRDNGISGIFIQRSSSTTMDNSIDIYGNLIFNNGRTAYSGSRSSQLIFSANDFKTSSINIYNNVFYTDTSVVDTTYPQTISVGTGESATNGTQGTPTISFKNNIVYQSTCTSSVGYMIVDVNQQLTHNNNLIYCGTGESGYKIISGSTPYKTNAEVQTWEATAQYTDPTFTGGTLPTGFSGTYGTDMAPNQPYFRITSGDALNNGDVLASPYDKAINNAGTLRSSETRGELFDIGAYEKGVSVYFVKNGGNDSLDGTSDETAWAHSPDMAGWTGGTSPLAAGDIVYFREGDTWTSNAKPIITATEGVTYRGLGYGTTGTRAKIVSSVGFVTATTSYGMMEIQKSGVSVYDMEFDGANSAINGIMIGYTTTADIQDIHIEGCYVHDIGFDDHFAIPSANVTVRNDASYTYFEKTGGVDWTQYASVSSSINTITWSGFSSTALNGTFYVRGVTANQIKVPLIAGGYTDSNTVTGDSLSIHYLYGIIVGQSDRHTTKNVQIINNTVTRTSHEGITVYPSRNILNKVQDVLIRGNIVGDNGYLGGESWGEGIGTGLNSENVIIEYNYIYNSYGKGGGVAVYADIPFAGCPKNITYRYNIFHNVSGTASTALSTQPKHNTDSEFGNLYIYGNLFIDTGIQLGAGHYYDADVKIYNNTIATSIANQSGIYLNDYLDWNTGFANFDIRNNIIQTGSATASYSVRDEGNHLSGKMDYNIYYRPSGTNLIKYGGSSYYTAADIVSSWDSHAITTDPKFLATGDKPTGFTGIYGTNMIPNKPYYSITDVSSPALGSGYTLLSPFNDAINWAGTDYTYKRKVGAFDRGAYQLNYEPFGSLINIRFGVGAKIFPGVGAKIIPR